jgi:hypothetical protein
MRAIAPIPENARKTKPVTSTHSWWATPAKWVTLARTPLDTAPIVRERRVCWEACWAATLAAIPNLRAIDTLFILCDFSNNPVRRRGTIWGSRAPGCEAAEPYAASNHARTETRVDQQLKQLMKELGEAINESLADSDAIAEVVSRIKDGGYDIFLVLEATIGVSKPGEKASEKTSLVTTLASNPELRVSDQDLKFLKSLRITIEEDAA